MKECYFLSVNSSVGIATGYWLHSIEAGVHFPAETRDASLLHNIEAAFWVHPASSPEGNGGYLHLG
jgi:hypothetical protein